MATPTLRTKIFFVRRRPRCYCGVACALHGDVAATEQYNELSFALSHGLRAFRAGSSNAKFIVAGILSLSGRTGAYNTRRGIRGQ